MIIKGQRPLIDLDESIMNDFPDEVKEELRILSKIQMEHELHIEEKGNKQFLKKLQISVCFDDNRPNYQHDFNKHLEMINEITCLISSYAERC